MSTTKYLILTERPGTNIEIANVDGRPAIIVTDNYKSTMAYFEPADGAKTALAILDSAGYTEGDKMAKDAARSHFGDAVESLAVGVGEQGRATAEAKEQAELEAEARDFYDVYHSAADWPYQDWVMLEERYKAQFIAVARKAREMAKEPSNGR